MANTAGRRHALIDGYGQHAAGHVDARTTHALCDGNTAKRRKIKADIRKQATAYRDNGAVSRSVHLVTPQWVEDCVAARCYLDPSGNGSLHTWM